MNNQLSCPLILPIIRISPFCSRILLLVAGNLYLGVNYDKSDIAHTMGRPQKRKAVHCIRDTVLYTAALKVTRKQNVQ